ncbi:MAG TPA: hypothetical protein VFZ81_14500 [Burkholderiales bacterium]
MRPIAALLIAAAFDTTHGANILEARYNAARDEIVAEIAYRGTNPDHEFTIQWGACSEGSPARVVGRLIDAQGSDVARGNYRTTERIALGGIPCRPAIVTLRLGRTAHTDVFVPRHVELIGGAPGRPYDEIGRIEARGRPGEQRSSVYQELRNKARALGADAVIQVEERAQKRRRLPQSGASEAPLLGNAYPAPARKTEPGAFPPAGFDLQTSGPYYEVRGIAVRFVDER